MTVSSRTDQDYLVLDDGELPEEGDPAEAAELVQRHPIRLPTYRLERIAVATLHVDYAPPHGNGYARPLSEGRLKRLRAEWDPLACGPLVCSLRDNGMMYLIDGNHRRVVAYEKGMTRLPAMVHSGLERATEADLYTKLGTVLGQTPTTRFQSKLAAGDPAANDIVRIMDRYGLTMATTSGGWHHGTVMAVARIEYIYARGGADALGWVLALLTEAFPDEREALTEMFLEGAYGFWYRYQGKVNRHELGKVLQAAGIAAIHDRAASTWAKIDLGQRSNTYGHAFMEIWSASRKDRKLPRWERIQYVPEGVKFGQNQSGRRREDLNPAPQQLVVAS